MKTAPIVTATDQPHDFSDLLITDITDDQCFRLGVIKLPGEEFDFVYSFPGAKFDYPTPILALIALIALLDSARHETGLEPGQTVLLVQTLIQNAPAAGVKT